MSKKKTQTLNKQDAKLRQDIASFKASVVFLLFFAVIFFTISNFTYSRDSLYMPVRSFIEKYPFILALFFVLFGVCCVIKYFKVKNKVNEDFSYFSSSDACGVTLFLLVYALTFSMTHSTAVLLTVIVAYAIVYYVKQFFAKDFLLVTLLNVDIALALWLIFGNSGMTGGVASFAKIVFVIATALGFFAICYFCFKLLKDKNDCKKNKLTIIPAVISLAFAVVLTLAMLVVPETVTILISEIILLAQYVGLGVYYTVRLLNQ